MDEPETIWIGVHQGSGGRVWAQYAAEVLLRPFSDLAAFRMGWNAGSQVEEGLDRQLQWVEAQHLQELYPGLPATTDLRRLALRCVHAPGRKTLGLVLIGQVGASTEAEARRKAAESWEEVASTFPYDYLLRPATSQAAFWEVCGEEIVAGVQDAGDAVEVRRYVNEMRSKAGAILLPGQWRSSSVANEPVWRALSGCSKPVILQVTLQPVALREEERIWLLNQHKAADAITRDENENPLIRGYAAYASRVYQEQAGSCRHLFLEHVLLASPGGVPGYLGRVIGASLTHGDDRPAPLPGYQVREAGPLGQDYLSGSVMPWGADGECSVYDRFIYMMNAREAHVAFRFPYPSAGGLPGACFAYPGAQQAP